ncbi:MAG: ABC transporter ATP-binding protein [Bacteroidota bacterium]
MGVKKYPLLKAERLEKHYPMGKRNSLEVLKGVDLEINKGEIVVIIGPSGSGKSTLLHLLSGLDHPTEGRVYFEGKNLFAQPEQELTSFRNSSMGFIFQFHHLLPEFSALENVAMPALIGGRRLDQVKQNALALLQEVGLAERSHHRPNELSGGEQQRVAVARALMNEPRIIYADEPSGNLDEESGIKLHGLLVQLAKKRELTFVIATHNQDLTQRADRILKLSDGKLNPVKHVGGR